MHAHLKTRLPHRQALLFYGWAHWSWQRLQRLRRRSCEYPLQDLERPISADTWFYRRNDMTMREEKQAEEKRAMEKIADEGYRPSY